MSYPSRLVLLLVTALAIVLCLPAQAEDATLELIEIMHDKGTITDAEYRRLTAAAKDAERERHRAADGAAVPEWLSKVQLAGNLRLRYEYADSDDNLDGNGNPVDRDRARLRYQLGLIAQPTDRLTVATGLASGGDDPRSTNVTFDDNFSTKGIQLDYAYVEYHVSDELKAIGGKFPFKSYLWTPTDVFWDGDIRPEGVAVRLDTANPLGTLFAGSGYWVLNEFSDSQRDPYMMFAQLGQEMTTDAAFGTLAVTYYGYQNTDRPGTFNPDFSAGTNTDNQFDSVSLSGELGTRIPGGEVALVGDYIVNTETDTEQDQGFGLGAKLAIDRWSFKYVYADLDRNAVPDIFPDSDRFGGATDVKGHEIEAEYALTEQVEIGIDFYDVERKSVDLDERILQADLSVNFP